MGRYLVALLGDDSREPLPGEPTKPIKGPCVGSVGSQPRHTTEPQAPSGDAVLRRQAPGEDRIITLDELLQPDIRPCWACGGTTWWTDRYGVRHCRVCHPPPSPEVEG